MAAPRQDSPLPNPSGDELMITDNDSTPTGTSVPPTTRTNSPNPAAMSRTGSGAGSLRLVFVTGPLGPRNQRDPGPIPRPAPVHSLGRGCFFFCPPPLPLSGPPPRSRPQTAPCKSISPVWGPAFSPVPCSDLGSLKDVGAISWS